MSLDNGIQIGNIEVELSRLWEKKDPSQVRACLFNLILFSNNQKRTDYLQSLIYSIAEKFPCRILFFQEDPTAEAGYLKVTVTNEIFGKNNLKITSDQINVKMSSQQLNRIPFITLPHIVPDLPVYLLWGQDLTVENPVLSSLEQFASRLIYDVSCTTNLLMFSKRILSTMAAKPNLEFVDMDWMLTTGWRNVLGKIFDTPTAIGRLKTPKGIQISYNSGNIKGFTCTQALYVAGWLATQLDWKFVKQEVKENGKHLTFHNGVNEFDIILSPISREGKESIIEIEISSNDDHFYFISTIPNSPKVIVHVSTLETCELPFTIPLPSHKNEFPYIQELFYTTPSSHYFNMLKALAEMDKQVNA